MQMEIWTTDLNGKDELDLNNTHKLKRVKPFDVHSSMKITAT